MTDAAQRTRDLGRLLREVAETQERESRVRASAMTVDERLALGAELSMFSTRLAEAFRGQS